MNKSLKLVVIVIVTFILLNLVSVIVPRVFGAETSEEQIKSLALFVFLLGLVLPIIFITQFPHKIFYRYLGLFLIILQFAELIADYSISFDIYSIIQITVYVLALIGYIVFLILAIAFNDMKFSVIYLVILILSLLYNNPVVLNYFLEAELSTFLQVFFRMFIPFVFSLVILVSKCFVVSYESRQSL